MTNPSPPEQLSQALDYRFAEPALLKNALVHRSAPNEHPDIYPNSNERLEFLGDAVLDLVIARALYERFTNAPEGVLTRYKSSLVNEGALANLARGLNLGKYLILGRGEEETQGRGKPSILSDALEAVLGAIYLDGGMEAAEGVIRQLFNDRLETVAEHSAPRGDYKTALQEWAQANGYGLPRYQLKETSGPDHRRTYTLAVYLSDKEIAVGSGTSKRDAERLAARTALAQLDNDT